MDVPPFFASAMDGYAICSSDPIFSGEPPYLLADTRRKQSGYAVRRRTAREPRCADLHRRGDAAAMRHGGDSGRRSTRTTPTSYCRRARCRRRQRAAAGPRHRARRDARGRGFALGPFDLAWLTACGLTTASRAPADPPRALLDRRRVARAPATHCTPGRSTTRTVSCCSSCCADTPVSVDDLGILPDDPTDHRSDAAHRGARSTTSCMTSGGVSVGDADYVRDIVERLGRIEFWKIAIKPGKPLAYGRIGDCHFFGLPGNPVSTIVTFLMLVKPILATPRRRAAEPPLTVDATLSCRRRARTGSRRIPTRRVLDRRERQSRVQPTSDQSSNRIGSFRGANCLIEVPRKSGNLARGASRCDSAVDGLVGVIASRSKTARAR